MTSRTRTTTYRALDERAATCVAGLDSGDPLRVANDLIDRAVAFQDAGDFTAAEALLAQVEEMLA